jgi:hypothetical protein
MALYQSKTAKGLKPVVTIDDSDIENLPYEYVTEAALAANDIIDLGPIPAGYEPCDVALITDDLDNGGSPAITLSVGILNAGKTDLGAGATDTFISASNVGQAGGIARATSANVYLSGASGSERRLGVKVVAGPATAAAAGKKLMVMLACKR